MMISAIVSSATLRVFENGALNTGMPMTRAASRSTWFVPTEKQPIAINERTPSIASTVSCVRERMPSMLTPLSAARSAVPSSAVARRSTLV